MPTEGLNMLLREMRWPDGTATSLVRRQEGRTFRKAMKR